MSYTKTNWHDGDTISAAKLNKLENGIENSLSTELQSLYKTLAGKDYDGDPNPTDAEMIDAIAKDAQSGGSGSAGRVIDFDKLEKRTETLPIGEVAIYSGYESGLSSQDFINAWFSYPKQSGDNGYIPVTHIHAVEQVVELTLSNGSEQVSVSYNSSTGEFMTESNSSPK